MAEVERENELSRDLFGLALFVPGAFVSVLVLMDLVHPGGAGKTAQLAAGIVEVGGTLPPLILALGAMALGVVLYLRRDEVEVGRHAAGVAGIALGLGVLLGATSLGAGGQFGEATGGALARSLHELVGVVVGISLAVLGAWFAWLRNFAAVGDFLKSSEPMGAGFSEESSDGVTTAEAAALVPDENLVAYMEQVWKQARSSTLPRQVPPSPYPDDVRRKGLVPEGARVIQSPAPTTHASSIDLRPRSTVGSPGDTPVGEEGRPLTPAADLAADEEFAGDAARTADAPSAAALPGATPEVEEEAPTRSEALKPQKGKAPLGYRAFFDQTPERGATAADLPTSLPSRTQRISRSRGGPPAPSWEQPPLYEEERAEAMVEAEPLANLEPEGVEAEADEPEELEVAELKGELESEGEVEEAAELEEDEGDQEEYEEEDEEGDEDEEYEEDEEFEEDEVAEYDEDDEDEEEEEEEDELVDGEEDEELLDEEELEVEAEQEEEAQPQALDAEADAEEEDGESEAEEELEETLVDASAEASQEEPESEQDAITDSVEPEVVLEPQPAPASKRGRREPRTDRKTPARPTPAPRKKKAKAVVAPEGEELVRECGLLFLEHGRVAVSLLQRTFDLDFDSACEVLDELQERGLIGPYLGGQRRDILLTADEWLERVPSS
jgi:hypothetical protein